jgi:hypothetical protein
MILNKASTVIDCSPRMYDIWLFKNVNGSRAHTTDWLILVKKLPRTEQNFIWFKIHKT